MGYLLTQMFLYMLGAFLLGLLLGWIIWGRRGNVGGAELDGVRAQLTQVGREREALRLERDRLKSDLDACAAARAALEERLARQTSAPVMAPPAAPVRLVETPPPAPKPLVKDDLKKIRGIGRVNEARLNDLGVISFSQIAAWTAADAQRIGDILAFEGRIEREEWIEQAAILASGKTTEFSVRVEKGEVDTSK